jgi:P27 family predicted phage terminase small subunit
MKGRKPYPYEVIEGGNEKDRYTKDELRSRRKNEPKMTGDAKLVCPSHLSDDAKKEWRRIRALYKNLSANILSDLDVNALEIYCESLATYRKAMLKVRETSEVVASKTDPGKPKKNPWLTVANEAAAQMKKYGESLLLDPVSRARVGLAKKQDAETKTGMAAFLSKRADAK